LQRISPADPRDVYLMTDQGRLVIRSRVSSADLMRTKLPDATIRALFDAEGQTVVYKRADGREVDGVLRRVPRLRWAAAAELARLSVTDALTGLYNRRHLMDTLSSEAQRSRRLRRPFSVLLADVDHFKPYNDTHGHLAGDAALAKIADILRKTTRAVDCVARYGGEELPGVLLGATTASATLVAGRIRARGAGEPLGGGRITAGIGVAEIRPPSNGS